MTKKAKNTKDAQSSLFRNGNKNGGCNHDTQFHLNLPYLGMETASTCLGLRGLRPLNLPYLGMETQTLVVRDIGVVPSIFLI